MFKKDNMFKKVQMRFFGIVISILLTVFIALLVSINLIMEAVMQRQSKVVLRQIASGIEYDDKTSTFTYYRPGHDNSAGPPHSSEKDAPIDDKPPVQIPTKPAQTSAAAEELTESPTIAITDSPSDTPTEPHDPLASEDPTAPSDDLPTAAPQTPETSPQQHVTIAPTTPVQTVPQPTTDRVKPNHQETTKPSDEPHQHEPQKPTEPEGQKETYPNYGGDQWWNGGYPQYDPWKFPPSYDQWWMNMYYPPYIFPPAYSNEGTWNSEKHDHDPQETTDPPQPSTMCENALGLLSDENGIAQLANVMEPVLNGFDIVRDNNNDAKVFGDDKHREPIPKTLGSIDFFVIMADNSGKFIASLNNESLPSDTAQTYIDAILDDGAASGMLNSYQFCTLGKDNGTLMVFTDKSAELEMLASLKRTTYAIGIVCFIVLAVIAYFLSKKNIEPVKAAFDKQKQFISDASHELKTPLTVISANADVLSDEIGENKWLTYIKSQAERMNVLVNDLLSLTRLENKAAGFVCGNFELSKAVENTTLPFECRAFEENRHLEIDIQSGLTLNGSEKHIKQMTAIFIDNALKYSNDGGTVKVTLTEVGDKKLLSVFNTGSGVKESEKEMIFERFYRSDDSRCRATGGYGLGLAIAKSIIDKHRFKLTVDNHEGESICFNIRM